MTKRLSILLLLLLPASAMAQKEGCGKKKTHTENGYVVVRAPGGKYIEVVRQCKTDTFFGLHITYKDSYEHYNKTGVGVVLADGTKLEDPDARVYCTQQQSNVYGGVGGGSADGGIYQLQGFFRITAAHYQQLVTSPIVSVFLHNTSQAISSKDARLVMQYIPCVATDEE